MKILAVDTSGKEIGIAVFNGAKCLYVDYIQAERSYNRLILPVIKKALVMARVKLQDIDLFAATLGPGSFTGIRVGMAVMKAFSHGIGRRFEGLSVLDVLAAGTETEKRSWSVLEAGRDEVYAAEYNKTGRLISKTGIKKKYMLLSREKFFKKLKKNDTVAGLASEKIMIELNAKKSKIKISAREHIDMKIFASLMLKIKKTGKKGIYETGPVYIRAPEAEVKRKSRIKEEVKK